jgi:hypothetical protein
MNHFSSLSSRVSGISILLLVLATGSSQIFAAEDVVEVNGSIATPGDYSTYSFSVSKESFYYFDSLTNVAGLRWSLGGPSGSLVSARAMCQRAGAKNLLSIANHFRVQGAKQSSTLPAASPGTISVPLGRCENNTQNSVR